MSNENVLNQPLVSVILSVYNDRENLLESIQSILSQTYTHFELLIVNDGSESDIDSIVKDLSDTRVKYWKNTKNKGLAYSLNFLIEKSKGKYIARMDSDDISLTSRLEKQVAFLEKNKSVDVLASNVLCFGEKNFEWKVLEKDSEIKTKMLFGNCLPHPTVMFRKKSIDEYTHLYNEEVFFAQDYELWTRLAYLCRYASINESLLKYRTVNKSTVKEKSMYQSSVVEKYQTLYYRGNFNLKLPRFFFSTINKKRKNNWDLFLLVLFGGISLLKFPKHLDKNIFYQEVSSDILKNSKLKNRSFFYRLFRKIKAVTNED